MFGNLSKSCLISFLSVSSLINITNAENINQIIWRHDQQRKINYPVWKPVPKNEKIREKSNNLETDFNSSFNKIYSENIFEINPLIPINNFIEKRNINSKVEWKSSFGGGAAGGTGQQNNLFRIDYGLRDFTQLTGYFTEADDDTYNYINSKRAQYFLQTYALSLKQKIWSSENLNSSLSFLSSIEYLRISSGSEETKSIFNESDDLFGKDKFGKVIYSFSIPFTKKLNNKISYFFVPGFVSLPEKLGSKSNRNNFYGNNFYIGQGITYKFLDNLLLHGSITNTLGPGSNHFDKNLNFSRKPIYSFGINWDLNPIIGIETKLTNGFGSTPSTGILTLPSRNITLYAANITYRPYEEDTPLKTLNERDKLISYGGITVNNALIQKNGINQITTNIDSKGNYFASYGYSLSNIFQIELINLGTTNNSKDNIHINRNFNNLYLDENNLNLRIGGKFLLFSPQKNDALWTSFRTSLGRNESTNQGYIFSELINTYRINSWLASNLSGKYFLSGPQKFAAIGSSFYLNISDKIQIIPETNILLSKNLRSNYTISIRYGLNENKSIDLYSSNALGIADLSQILVSKENRVGIKLNLLY